MLEESRSRLCLGLSVQTATTLLHTHGSLADLFLPSLRHTVVGDGELLTGREPTVVTSL